MIFFHTKFRMLLDWTASRIQFHQTSLTNVAKFLLLQVFLNIRHKLFEFQTFMNQTQIINSTDIIIYFTDTYYLYYKIGPLWPPTPTPLLMVEKEGCLRCPKEWFHLHSWCRLKWKFEGGRQSFARFRKANVTKLEQCSFK